jgi:two-component system probable response regulator PhcQ
MESIVKAESTFAKSPYDYKKFAILYVDDEEKSLKYFTLAFEDQFRILTATNARQGLEMLEKHGDQIGLLMSDQRMPGEKGVWLLEKARQLYPRIIRILATAFADMDAAIAAVNTGSIYRYVSKPWDPPQLDITLKRGLEFFVVQRERDQLLKEKMSVLHNMMIADRMVSLGLLAAGLSHHIRNSLVAVKTFLDLAPVKLKQEDLNINELRNPDFWKDYHHNVQGQIDKINDLLKDLWQASEPPSFKFCDQINIRQQVEQTLQSMGPAFASKNIAVHNRIPEDLPLMEVDQAKFRRLFDLLLKDELVSLPEGAEIVLEAEAREGGPDHAPEIVLQLRDNGPGLPEEALRLVFDPFSLRKESPTEYGINLMACYFIAHHHGGNIQAQNNPDRGTTFTLHLPINANQPLQSLGDHQFLQKVLLNNSLWEKLMSA